MLSLRKIACDLIRDVGYPCAAPAVGFTRVEGRFRRATNSAGKAHRRRPLRHRRHGGGRCASDTRVALTATAFGGEASRETPYVSVLLSHLQPDPATPDSRAIQSPA